MPESRTPLPPPHLYRKNGDLITAEDWNEIQQLARQELYDRASLVFQRALTGTVEKVDGVWVVTGEKQSSGEEYLELPGLLIALELPWPAVIRLVAHGRASADLSVAFWVNEKKSPEREAPARVSVGLAQKAEVPDYGALPWSERVSAWTDRIKTWHSAKDLNARTPCGTATSATLLVMDTITLPAGSFELTLCAAGEGTPASVAVTAICTPFQSNAVTE